MASHPDADGADFGNPFIDRDPLNVEFTRQFLADRFCFRRIGGVGGKTEVGKFSTVIYVLHNIIDKQMVACDLREYVRSEPGCS